MQTRKQIIEYFGIHDVPEVENEIIDRLRALQIQGALHGRKGYYPDSDFSSDADWCYGPGAEIAKLEELLEIDDSSVFDLYAEAHSQFFRDGTINPGDRDCYSRNSRFDFTFGAYGDTHVSVWAQADHLDDALEIATEWLAEHAPGHLASDEEMASRLKEECEERGFTPEDIDWSDLRGEHAAAVEAAESDLTYTESGYLTCYEWSVTER